MKKKLVTRFDVIHKKVVLTPRVLAAIKELAIAEMEMMKKFGDKECWDWADVTVGDLCYQHWLAFEFGSNRDRPKGMKGNYRVQVALEPPLKV